MILVLASLGSLLLSIALTRAMISYALSANLMDRPNERSSHKVPTPRGGGVAFVVTFLIALVVLHPLLGIDPHFAMGSAGAGVVVAVLGFVDDRRGLKARTRFAGHLLAACWFLYFLGSVPPMPIFGFTVDLGIAGFALAALFLVWMINLFNFMDGIDGLASLEAVAAAAYGALLWALREPSGNWTAAVLLACCVAGFLVWNFPPARIFMGDAGSGFLGLIVAALALWCGRAHPELFWSWLILIGCFMVDATTTLVRRVRRGDRFSEAHRSHAYQYASRKLGAHRPVTLWVFAINTVWLLPIAAAVALGRLDGMLGLVIAYAPLVTLAFRFKAGDRAAQEV